MSGKDLTTAESLADLLMIPLVEIDQIFGNLFYRKIQPSELYAMSYHELKYWDKWHKLMADADKKAADKLDQGKK